MTIDGAVELFRGQESFAILSHDGPDADGVGAGYALALALAALGKKACALVSDGIPPKFRFIDRRGLFLSLAEGEPTRTVDGRPFDLAESTAVLVDTRDIAYMGARSAEVLSRAPRRIVIDHHEPREEPGEHELVDAAASSVCELVYLISSKLGVALPLDAAEALYSGIVYDTGSFCYPKTSERTFEVALALVRSGVSPNAIYGRMHESAAEGFLSLEKAVLSTLELSPDGRIAIQSLSKEELAASGAAYEDAEELVNIPLQDRKVEVSVLFKENAEGRLRCSLRSKGGVNVARFAQAFGGGGHKTAAGFTCRAPLAASKADVLQSLSKVLRD
jgi:bifunctional oligoribonuclease and PAP phosphatase NrnA